MSHGFSRFFNKIYIYIFIFNKRQWNKKKKRWWRWWMNESNPISMTSVGFSIEDLVCFWFA